MTYRVALAILVLAVGGTAELVEEGVTAFSADESVELLQLRGSDEVAEEEATEMNTAEEEEAEEEIEEADDAQAEEEIEEADDALPGFQALTSHCVGAQHLAGTSKTESSLEACHVACTKYPGCAGFDYYAFKKVCYLKSNCGGTPGGCKQSKGNSCGYKYRDGLGPYWDAIYKTAGVSAADTKVIGCYKNVWMYKGVNTKVGCGLHNAACSAPFCAGKSNYGFGKDQAAAVKKAIKNGGTYSLLDQTDDAEADEEVQDEVAEEQAVETEGPSCKGWGRTPVTNCWNVHGNCDQWYESSKKVCAIDKSASKATNPYYVPIGGQWWCKPETNAYTSTPPGKHRTNLGNRNCLTVHGGSCDIYYETSTKICVPDRHTKKKPIPGQWWCKPSTAVCSR